jgi:hypothetical protein
MANQPDVSQTRSSTVRDRTNTANGGGKPTVTVILVASVVAVLAVVGVGVYGLWFAPKPGPSGGPPPSASAEPAAAAPNVPADVPDTSDSERFARQVAEGLFAWDTATMDRSDVTDKLIAVGDPAGEETAGLASDIANYLPDPETWVKLRGMGTRQWLDIDTVETPDKWGQAVRDAAPGQILPGTVAYTVTGVRHRDGVWEDEPAVFQQPVTFTVFVTCQPAYPECRLMRLSKLGDPL